MIYAIEDLKVHSKIVLVERRESSGVRGYAYIGTGNFNGNTATIYGDFGLLTAHKGIVGDVRNVFQFLTNSHKQFKYRHLPVLFHFMREAFDEMIDREIRKPLRRVFDIQWADNVKARDLADQKRTPPHVPRACDQKPHHSRTERCGFHAGLLQR